MPTSSSTPRNAARGEPDFPAWLAALSDDALVRLCELRPDVANPPPASLDVLASRLRLPASTARAIGTLTWPDLLILATAAALGADSGPVPLAAVAARVGVDDDEDAFRTAVRGLRDLALIWGEETHARIVPVTGAAIDAAPVTAPHPGEPTGAALEAAWSGLSAGAVGVLEAIARGRTPVGSLGAGASGTVRAAAAELAAAGLAEVTGDDGEVVVPRAHAVDRARHGVRPVGSSLLHTPAWSAPAAASRAASAGLDASGGVAALDLLHRCDALLSALSVAPAATLKAGGVGVRELRRVARAAALEEHEPPLLLEVLAAAGLIAVGDTEVGDTGFDSVWAPTEAADVWSAREPARRWAELVLAWWSMPRAAWRVGSQIEGGGPVPALGDPVGPPAPTERSRVLRALSELGPASDPGDALLPEVVRWFSPVWFSRAGARPCTETVDEARRLGLVVGTTATTAARLLAAGSPTTDDLEPVLTAALPDPVSEVIVQADLTILAPGPLVPDLAADFAQLADVESAGAATTYRVTENSLRRALDSGRTAAGIRELLARTSITPVPQSLDYLIEDVARRHGRLRVGSALSFLRCDDPTLIAHVLGSPVAEACSLRSVAPTVLVSQARPLDLVETLREHGFAPVVEDTTGAVVALSRPVARVTATAPRRAPRVPTRVATPAELRAAITAMRAADRVRSARGGTGAGYTGEAAIARLHEAASTGTAVTVSVVDAQGRSTSRIVVPASVAGGRIEGIEPDSAETVTLPLHRVISVADLDPTR
ncbi:helicase-associated domain-containing protein [uncultured Dietzia sp.]|uniref:helicase-associated domain-containing protein n=1 Tax=uncultured Dietzia sp. TaxID=395519 RepID=UPI0026204FF3|nr:helicase-associated domain-containing protein [uncultured Dietzia sp.]HMT49609.1 helicase-associated domain-containing protein [Dietzia sp.]